MNDRNKPKKGPRPLDPRPEDQPRPWRPSRPIGLARALLKAGYATRRQAEQFVRDGRVQVGDEVVTDPRHMVESGATIQLDGAPLVRLQLRYFALHKPLGVICGDADSGARRRVTDFFPPDTPGLAAAGRMDTKTTGLMLFSNDTVWNTMVTTTNGLEQEYRIQVEGILSDMEISVMGAGVLLPGLGTFRPQAVRVVEQMQGRTVINMTVREGKVRQLRRMLETLRHRVKLVRRVRIGEIRLADLPVGGVRELSNPEVKSIRDLHATLTHRAAR